MKFDESSITEYLVKNLESLTETDPAIVADFIIPLLKKDKPVHELQKLCVDNLVEFLGHGTKSFVSQLFKTFGDDDIMISEGAIDSAQTMPIAVDHMRQRALFREEEDPSVSRQFSDSEEKEISDDDDDRNHKHRRRDNRSQSLENVHQGSISRPRFRKSNPDENGRRGFQSSEIFKEYSPLTERDSHRVASTPSNSGDSLQKSRMGRGLRPNNSSRFDPLTNSLRPPFGGRGRGAGSWNQHETRFNPLDPLAYASQMPSLLGSGFSSAPSASSTSWNGSYGFLPGMPNGSLDPLHPLGLQGALHPPINLAAVGLPRQRCRDFEERGFCLRGDMCPMEHGVNRIVVEDVQSLSQFNLPVSLPTTSILGVQAAIGPLAPATSSTLLSTSKSTASKVSKAGASSAVFGADRVVSAPAAESETDVYDPDQPLWSNVKPEASNSCLVLPPQNEDVAPPWETGLSDMANEQLNNSAGDNRFDSLPPAWGRAKPTSNFSNNTRRTTGLASGNGAREEADMTSSLSLTSSREERRRLGNATPKAQRTLGIHDIPQKNNTKEALFSHFSKFGEIIDIHIPASMDRAFVQFSTREEADAALQSPEAVMGNRFIKLSWAARDNIPDAPVGKRQPPPAAVQSTLVAGKIPPRERVEKKDLIIQKTAVPLQKAPVVVGPKSIPQVPKKMENLDSLKEELRKKQEALKQKRDEFKLQLEKLQKQTLSTKTESVVERPTKKSKVDDSSPHTSNHEQQISQGKANSREMIISPPPKLSTSTVQHSPKSLKLSSHSPGFPTYRFKIDNRPTGFRVVSPLPDGLASVDALKEHFSTFGDLTAVELDGSDSAASSTHSALIIFASRRSAEVAFSYGNSWHSHSLQFAWMAPGTNYKSALNAGGLSSSKLKDCASGDAPTLSSSVDQNQGEVEEAEKGVVVAPVPFSLSDVGSQASEPPADDGHADPSSGN